MGKQYKHIQVKVWIVEYLSMLPADVVYIDVKVKYIIH